jgi:lipopolysaccharide export system permease protein
VWSLAMMGFAEFIVPETTALRDKIKTERIEKKSPRSQLKTRNILYLTGDGRVFSIGFLDPKKGFARDILIVAFGNDDKIKELIRAREMNFNGKKWTLKDGHKYNFTADYSAAPDNPDEEVYERFSEKDIFIRETPQELAARRADPNEMGFFELRDFIKRVEKAGGRPIAEKTDLIMKISYPFINFIILLFGVPLVLRFRRGGMVYGFAQSVTIAFLYFAAIRVGQTLGYNATLPPYVAATLGNALFGTCGFVLLLTFRE